MAIKLRGGIIGVGNVALHGHLPAWGARRDVEIVAVTDARNDRRAACAAALPGARWYDSVDALVEDPRLDFVDICTPPASHAGVIRRALQRGLHVLCEKPLVRTTEDLAWVASLADKSRRVLHTVHNWHHAPIVRRTSELVQEGAIGAVCRVVWHTQRTRPAAPADESVPNWRIDPAVAGGGILTDHGWHVFYLLRRWIGAMPTAVSAQLDRRRHVTLSVEDTASVRVTFPAATADILLTWAADVRQNWAEVVGTKGRLELRDDTLVWHRGMPSAARQWRCPPALSDGSHHPDWFHAVVDEFLAEVTSERPKRENLAEASLCLALESAARESSRHAGRLVPVAVGA
jgi:predicted dehydrogenase